MKRCPGCGRDYNDDSLSFCLDDGSELLFGPANSHSLNYESATAVLNYSVSQQHSETLLFSASSSPEVALNSIAVLPFRNLSSRENTDGDGDYFSDGVAEELLNVLSKIDGLSVAARTSAFSFRNSEATIAEIGRALRVATVCEGTVRTVGKRVRISVGLVKVSDGFQLWSETYDRTLDDIFAVQDDIAQSVVQELRGLLLGIEPEKVPLENVESDVADAVRGRSADPEAHRLMLLGRYRLALFTRDDANLAVDCFKRAIAIDPDFALGWVELARSYSILAGRSWIPVDLGFAMSRNAVSRALELEPDLAEAYAQLGRIQAAYELDLKAAEASYQRAMELAPGSSAVLDGASILAYKLGDFERALELSRRVLDQDPLNGPVWHNFGLLCHSAEMLDEAESAFARVLEIGPNSVAARALAATVLADRGDTEKATEYAIAEPEELWRDWAIAIVGHRGGDKATSDGALERLKRVATESDAFQIAEVYAVREENDAAFDWLERAYLARDPGITHAMVDPRFRGLANDGRWIPFLERIGLSG